MKHSKKKAGRGNLVRIGRQYNPVLEQFRSLRSNLKFATDRRELNSLVITSPNPSDGKTMAAANLAVVFSQEGKKVLLVDADLRKPSIHSVFELANNDGLSNYLIEQKSLEADAIPAIFHRNLNVLPSGIIPPNPPELLGSEQMSEFIEMAKKQYDMVIFDTPPVLAVTDATLIANQCDGVLLVVRAKKSERKDVMKAKEQLCFSGANLLGAVLNGKKTHKDLYYYH
ncbi:CpsD/CapB family tyrosine-protein kinase [Virgibacillus sp. FSP13]